MGAHPGPGGRRAPFEILWVETLRAPSRPLGGERRAISVRFPARGQGDPRHAHAPVRPGGRPRRCLTACGVNLRASCYEEMGAAVIRAIRNFNLENRAEREISRMKPSAAPRHPSTKNLLREQMSSKCGPGRVGPRDAGCLCGLGCSTPVDLGPVVGVTGVGCSHSGQPNAGRGSHQAGDIETVPLRSRWRRRLRLLRSPGGVSLCPRCPRPRRLLSLMLSDLMQGIKIRRDRVQENSLDVFTE